MRHPVVSLIPVAALVACNLAGAGVHGSGTAASQRRTVGAFTGVSVSGAIHLELAIGTPPSIEITGDDNVVPLIRTELHGTTLDIDSRESYQTKLPLVVRVVAPDVTTIAASGASSAIVRGIRGDHFAASLSGAGKLDLAGTADTLAIETSGAGAVAARDLAANDVTVSASGAGKVALTATRSLTADVSGAAAVDYWGHPPSVTPAVSGAASLTAR